MADGIQGAKAYLTAHSKQLAEALVSMVTDPKTPATVKLKAIEMALDRIGLPALKATITQKVGPTIDVRALQDTKAELTERQKELMARLDRVTPAITAKNGESREVRNARETAKVLPYPGRAL